MSAARIVEAVDVLKDGYLSLPSRLPRMLPDQFNLDGFEEGFDDSVIITITLAAHRCLEAMLAQDLLIVVRAIL